MINDPGMQKAFVARPLVKPSGSMTAIKIIGAVFAAMVALLTWIVMPLATRALHSWLHHES